MEGVTDGVAVTEGVTDGVAVLVTDGVIEGVALILIDTVIDGVIDIEGVTDGVGDEGWYVRYEFGRIRCKYQVRNHYA